MQAARFGLVERNPQLKISDAENTSEASSIKQTRVSERIKQSEEPPPARRERLFSLKIPMEALMSKEERKRLSTSEFKSEQT